jgi:hypothetical protein
VTPDTIRLLLVAAAVYIVFKTATAPRRGKFLTVFGNIRPEIRPRAFRACLLGGYALAAVLLLYAIFPDLWLPIVSGL